MDTYQAALSRAPQGGLCGLRRPKGSALRNPGRGSAPAPRIDRALHGQLPINQNAASKANVGSGVLLRLQYGINTGSTLVKLHIVCAAPLLLLHDPSFPAHFAVQIVNCVFLSGSNMI